jgi:hypothetical protein
MLRRVCQLCRIAKLLAYSSGFDGSKALPSTVIPFEVDAGRAKPASRIRRVASVRSPAHSPSSDCRRVRLPIGSWILVKNVESVLVSARDPRRRVVDRDVAVLADEGFAQGGLLAAKVGGSDEAISLATRSS